MRESSQRTAGASGTVADRPSIDDGPHESINEAPTLIEGALQPHQRPSVDTMTPLSHAVDATIAPVRGGLHDAEASRASTIGLVFGIIGLTALLWAPFLSGHPPVRSVYMAALMGFTLANLAVWRIAKSPSRYTVGLFRALGAINLVTAIVAMVFLGPFSPTALAITLGIGFFGHGSDRVGAWCICGTAIVLCLFLLVGVTFGWFPDIGVFKGSEAGIEGQLFMLLMVPMVLLVTLLQAHWSRRAISVAMESAISAVMDVNRKNVQLAEAQAELERLFGDGGLMGRLSGQTVGKYALGPLLGSGSSGEVYDAMDPSDQSRAAVKLLNSPSADHPSMIARFEREGIIARGIESRHVAEVYAYGKSEQGHLYIAMERLDGADLAAILRKRGRISSRAAHRMIRHVCAGLAAAHEQGVIHRDIKPHNLYAHMDPSGRRVWKVLDFGISKWLAGSETLTQAGHVVGTPRYMAPEQARGQALSTRSDIYSLGAVLYRCLTGRPPSDRAGWDAIAAAAYVRPVRPRELAPDLDRQLESVLAVAMAPEPEDRFADAAEFAEAYDRAYRGELDRAFMLRARKTSWRTLSKQREKRPA